MRRLQTFFLSMCCGAIAFFVPFFVSAQSSGGWASGLQAVKDNAGLPGASVKTLVGNFMLWILTLFGFLAIIGFVISGILYLTAAGNTSQTEKAKTAMLWSIVGVIVALLGAVVVYAVDEWLGGGSSTF